jgi:hypothetical protein
VKVPVNKTVTEEVEVELPLYGSWFGDIDDGRVSYETWFCISENLELRTVSEWEDCDRPKAKWDVEISRLRPDDVGNYLKYDRIEPSKFQGMLDHALAIIAGGKL